MKIRLVTLNPLDVFLWTLRRNEKDIVRLYDSLSPVMQVATGGSMLNFGYWTDDIVEPISSQENLCSYFGELAELDSAKNIVDVGSGLSAPAIFWRNQYQKLQLFCVNINRKQLSYCGNQKNISFVNSTSTHLPFSDNSFDRVLALESAQHFKPLENFISESKRVLTSSGLFVLALPIVLNNSSFKKLGILKFTWSSEHYNLEFVHNLIEKNGFKIVEEKLIGSYVYEPLANYYSNHRQNLRDSILKQYSEYVEKILFKSIIKMKKTSEAKIIDYVIIKCKPVLFD